MPLEPGWSALPRLCHGAAVLHDRYRRRYSYSSRFTSPEACLGDSCEHRAATGERTALTHILPANDVIKRIVDHQLVVDKEFLARFNVLDGFDEHPPRLFDGLAVGSACVIDPPRPVAAITA